MLSENVYLNTNDELNGELAIVEAVNHDGTLIVNVVSYGERIMISAQEIINRTAPHGACPPGGDNEDLACHYCGGWMNIRYDFFDVPACEDCS